VLANPGSSANLLAVPALTSPKLGGRRPFARAGVDNVGHGAVGSPLVVPAVPQGKVLVIEYVDFKTQTAVTSGTITRYELVHKTGGAQFSHALPVFSSANNNGLGSIFLGREQVRFYADPGSQVFVQIFPDGSASGPNASPISVVANISRYLVDAQ